LVKKDGHYDISVYSDDLTEEGIVSNTLRLKSAFPALNEGFYSVFLSRIKERGFGDSQLKDAIDHVIDNCTYPTPTIAQFLSFDKRIKFYDYKQFMDLNDEMHGSGRQFYELVKLEWMDKPMYCHKNDVKLYNLPIFKYQEK